MAARARRIGVLALQGGFDAHLRALARLGLHGVAVRSARDLDGVEGLVMPGGESPAQLRALQRDPALVAAWTARVDAGLPLFATCAGLILAATEVIPQQASFGWIDVTVRRNAYGPQLYSAEAIADDGHTPLVLIRAPRIERVGPEVEVLLTLDGAPVLVRQGPRSGATFHPELTSELGVIERALASVMRAA